MVNIPEIYRKHKIPILIGAGIVAACLIVWKRKAIWYYIKLPINMATDYLNSLKIEMLNPKVRPLFQQLFDKIKASGYDVIITSTYRDYTKAKQLNQEDARNPLISFHTYGLACDINIVNQKTDKRYMKATSKAEWEATGIPKLIRSFPARWGGDFSTYYDPIHIDFGNKYPIATLNSLATKQYGSDQSKWDNKVKIS
jgi:hypothetical protein